MLNDHEPTVQVVEHGETAHQLTRGDLARFLVDNLQPSPYVNQIVTIANS